MQAATSVEVSSQPMAMPGQLEFTPTAAAKVAELTRLLQREMDQYADKAPLKVASPQPAAWAAPGKNAKQERKAAAK